MVPGKAYARLMRGVQEPVLVLVNMYMRIHLHVQYLYMYFSARNSQCGETEIIRKTRADAPTLLRYLFHWRVNVAALFDLFDKLCTQVIQRLCASHTRVYAYACAGF